MSKKKMIVCLTENLLLSAEEVNNHVGHKINNVTGVLQMLREQKMQEDTVLAQQKEKLALALQSLTELECELETRKSEELKKQQQLQQRLLDEMKQNVFTFIKQAQETKAEIVRFKSEIEYKEDLIDVLKEQIARYLANIQSKFDGNEYEQLLVDFVNKEKEHVEYREPLEYEQAFSAIKKRLSTALCRLHSVAVAEQAVKMITEYKQHEEEEKLRWQTLRRDCEQILQTAYGLKDTLKTRLTQLQKMSTQYKRLLEGRQRWNEVSRHVETVFNRSETINRDIATIRQSLTGLSGPIVNPAMFSMPQNEPFGVFISEMAGEMCILYYKQRQGLKIKVSGLHVTNYAIGVLKVRVLIVGGRDEHGLSVNTVGQIYPLHVSSMALSAVASMAHKRELHCLCEVGAEALWTLGGLCQSSPESWVPLAVCESYDASTDKWSAQPSLNDARYNAAVCSTATGYLYLFSGRANPKTYAGIEVLNKNALQPKWEKIVASVQAGLSREGFGCFEIAKNKILLVGGPGQHDTSFAVFDTALRQAIKAPETPRLSSTHRLFSQAKLSMIDGQVHLIDQEGTWHMYTPGTDLWKARPFSEWERACIKKEP